MHSPWIKIDPRKESYATAFIKAYVTRRFMEDLLKLRENALLLNP